MKEFLLLLREDLNAYKGMNREDMQADIDMHMKWVEELSKKGQFKHGNPLSAEGSFLKSSQTATDGPYAEGKEGVSGFYFLLANDLKEATEIAKGCPTLKTGGTVEVREIFGKGE